MPSLPIAPTQFALTPQTRTQSSTAGLTPSSTAGVNPLTPVVNRNVQPTNVNPQTNPGGATGFAPIAKPPTPTGGGAPLQSNSGANDPGFGAGLNGGGFGNMTDQDRAFLWYMNNQYRNDLSNQPGAHQMFFDMFGNGNNKTQVNQLINDIGYNHLTPGRGPNAFNINNYNGQFRDRYNQLVQQHGGQLNQYGHNAYMDNVVRQDAINRFGPNLIDFRTGQKVSDTGSTPASNAGVSSDPSNGQYTGFGGISYAAQPGGGTVAPTSPASTAPTPSSPSPSPVPAGTTPSAVTPTTTPGTYAGTPLGGMPTPMGPARTTPNNVAPPPSFPTPTTSTVASRPTAPTGIGRWNSLMNVRS